jgi:GGDEF domain-containing protein
VGLGNRDGLLADLASLDRGAHGGVDPQALLLLELDGLQRYTQSFGQLAGDALVARLAQRLARACPPPARAYRLGGGRFAALAPRGTEDSAALRTAAVAAMSERGEGFRIRVLCGSVEIPEEVTPDAHAVDLADRRVATARDAQAESAPAGMRQIMLRRLREKRGVETGVGCTMGELARNVAAQVGLDHEATARTALAAELHDIGKAAIPREILAKPSALDKHEWVFVQRSPAVGERIVSVTVPGQEVAAIVRAASERYDGAGYPDGLAGDAIPLEARVVAVCGALEAMLSERPYRPPRSLAEALSELQAGSGGQFDPRVVQAVTAVLHSRAIAQPILS